MEIIYVLDKDLSRIALVENYCSLIWANRYWDLGDCEVYTNATPDAFALFAIGRYIQRPDDDMICRIDKVELKTSAESGDYLIVHGVDAKILLDQRIIWETVSANGSAETFARKLVTDNLISPADADRTMFKPLGGALMKLDTAEGLPENSTEQVSYKNVGEKIRQICRRYGWGYRLRLDAGQLAFGVYAGADRRAEMIFAGDYGNLVSTDYVRDATDIVNVALVAGSGEGSLRKRDIAGSAHGTRRFETFVDARNVSTDILWNDVITAYPNGTVVIDPTSDAPCWQVPSFDIQIFDFAQLDRVRSLYPAGTLVSDGSGNRYWRVPNCSIVTMRTSTPDPSDIVTMLYPLYSPQLVAAGYDAISGHGETQSFNGEIDPGAMWTYRVDYGLGDIVTIRNEYGLSVAARIVEVVEVSDENGYRVEPKYEYIE